MWQKEKKKQKIQKTSKQQQQQLHYHHHHQKRASLRSAFVALNNGTIARCRAYIYIYI